MRECRVIAEMSSAALDGSLAPAESRQLAAHLVLCRECAERDAELRALRRLLGDLRDEEPPAATTDLFSRIEADRTGPVGRLIRLVVGSAPPRGLLSSATVAALLAALTVASFLRADSAAAPGGDTAARPAVARLPREGGMLTVWDSGRETIAASVDPSGIAGREPLRRAGRRAPPLAAGDPRPAEVRIFLYERIVVAE